MEGVLGNAREERSALQRFSHSGLALIPWTKQMLTALWENLRLIMQVICCSLMAVFQMFRFEVHLRITDDTGEHLQHMTNAHGDTEGFLLSSLFESNKNVVVAGPSPLSGFNTDPFQLNSHSRAVLSSLVNDDLCCSLVDNLVSHASECLNENENACVAEHFSWKHRFDWNFHPDLESRADEGCVPYLHGKETQKQSDCCTGLECNLFKFKSLNSDSEFSWGSSDSSSTDKEREDSDVLWDLLRCPNDPYHPLHFTACISSAAANRERTPPASGQSETEFTPSPVSVSCCSDSSEQGNTEAVNSEDEEEALWKSLSWDDDPYHPLNFRAPLSSAHACIDSQESSPKTPREPTSLTRPKPFLLQRQVVCHRCPPLCVEKPAQVPWRRPTHNSHPNEASLAKNISTVKRVTFSPVVQVHRMRAWSFALHACRKGPWEEHARDRDRFQRRIVETERAIGYCFMQSHRDEFLIYYQNILPKQACSRRTFTS